MKKKASIIICAYNEETTIADVVRICRTYNPGNEIIVVDDGSADRTPEILTGLSSEIPFRYIRLDENQGKSNAMVVGVENAIHEVILFFDADVTGIRKKHFRQLLDPLTHEISTADMVVGSPSETLIDYRVNPFKSLTGERSLFKKDIEPILEKIRHMRFGVETYINLYYQASGKKIKYTLLDGLTHPTKYEKTDAFQATKEFISEGKEIAVTLLKNYDLITQSIGYSLDEQGEKVKQSLKKFQEELNDRIQVLLKNNG
jgi:glycosyltransferase involved in cell wall biosynthesis